VLQFVGFWELSLFGFCIVGGLGGWGPASKILARDRAETHLLGDPVRSLWKEIPPAGLVVEGFGFRLLSSGLGLGLWLLG
jgi:hypothetical protein